jgi:hypothetical protein
LAFCSQDRTYPGFNLDPLLRITPIVQTGKPEIQTAKKDGHRFKAINTPKNRYPGHLKSALLTFVRDVNWHEDRVKQLGILTEEILIHAN